MRSTVSEMGVSISNRRGVAINAFHIAFTIVATVSFTCCLAIVHKFDVSRTSHASSIIGPINTKATVDSGQDDEDCSNSNGKLHTSCTFCRFIYKMIVRNVGIMKTKKQQLNNIVKL